MLSLQSSSAPHPQKAPPLGHEWNPNKDRSGTSTPPGATRASPSDSAVIGALHLSSIDWDAVSFTSSPPAQSSAANPSPAAEVRNPSSDCQEAASRCALLCYTERSLWDRLLSRNVAKGQDVVSKQLNSRLSPDTHSSCPNSDAHEDVLANLNRIEPLSDKIHYTSDRRVHGRGPAAEPSHGSQKPPQTYEGVKKPVSSPQKRGSDPSPSRKNVPRIKNSVCASRASSSEESDAENQQLRPRAKARIRPMTKIKANLHSDVALKPTSGPEPPSKSVLPVQPPRPQEAASPVAAADSDDSVACSESPLPLAERLRLRFLK